MFNDFYNKQRELCPDEPKYISLCKVLQYSGEERPEIEHIFVSYMKEGEDYDRNEFEEMVSYLVEQAKDPI